MSFSMTSLRVAVCCRVNLTEVDRFTVVAVKEEDKGEGRLCAQLESERKRNTGDVAGGAMGWWWSEEEEVEVGWSEIRAGTGFVRCWEPQKEFMDRVRLG